MTALWWSASIGEAVRAQDGLPTHKPVTESGRTPQSTVPTSRPNLGKEEQRQAIHQYHLPPLTPPEAYTQGSGMIHRHTDRPTSFLLTETASYNTNSTIPWPVQQSFDEGHHVQRDIPHHFLVSTRPRRSYAMMPLEINRPVKRILDYYQHDIHGRFQRYLNRFEKYKNLVQRVFRKAGLPPELGYLSLVESGFNPRALSRARASGPWQFMKATGRTYGLDVTWYVDERRDPVKSTVAAAQHLKDLFDQFQSWPLALGAYNAGGPKIMRAIQKLDSRDFWKIRETAYLMRETKEYVPSFIAAVLIASNPTQYGFTVNAAPPFAYDAVLVRKRVHLKSVAKTTGISIKTLKDLNPELLQDIVPMVDIGYSLKVPPGKGNLVRERHDHIERWTKLPPESATWYHVRFGETLDDVANKFGLSVQELRQLNNLKEEDLIFWNDRLRLRTDDDSIPIRIETEPSPPPTWYHVRFGETLDDVANKFRLSVRKLRRLNNLKDDDLIFWKDRLRVRADEDDDPSLVPKSQPSPPPTWYHVRFGETLDDVAKKFGLSVQTLRRFNNLTEADQILWNDRLRVRAGEGNASPLVQKSEPSPPATWYRVRFGETLDDVAKKFGLSVRTLRQLNNLKEADQILWSDRLRVRADEDNNPSRTLKSESSSSSAWYRIQYGDTLTSIARKFGLSVTELKQLNNLKNDRIRSNERLRVRPDKDNLPVAFHPETDTP
ncbi:MAG: hypothetical protein NPIRA02_11150 [Nitrospirales bacterium]|nr:MAG: hypothetical protein NPIRA02_11150 [Nitrospirales bacterium]